MTKYQGHCPKCTSNEWDYANVGLPKALVCLEFIRRSKEND